jgi:hypothetical protein
LLTEVGELPLGSLDTGLQLIRLCLSRVYLALGASYPLLRNCDIASAPALRIQRAKAYHRSASLITVGRPLAPVSERNSKIPSEINSQTASTSWCSEIQQNRKRRSLSRNPSLLALAFVFFGHAFGDTLVALRINGKKSCMAFGGARLTLCLTFGLSHRSCGLSRDQCESGGNDKPQSRA